MIDDAVILRCKHCGAPLNADAVRSGERIVTCEYCGKYREEALRNSYAPDDDFESIVGKYLENNCQSIAEKFSTIESSFKTLQNMKDRIVRMSEEEGTE